MMMRRKALRQLGALVFGGMATASALQAALPAFAAGYAGDALASGVAPSISAAPNRTVNVAGTPAHPAYTVYAPADSHKPVRVLLVLHGMGGDGPSMAASILPLVEGRDWLVVAPTIPYGEWRDPNQLADDERRILPQLATLLNNITAETGYEVAQGALLLGFSRGAQTALRLTLFFPQRVHAVAAFSAGTYTLPTVRGKKRSGEEVAISYPFGATGVEQRMGMPIDLDAVRRVPVLVGVGGDDNNPADVPEAWNDLLGTTRVERARRFVSALQEQRCAARLEVVPGVAHAFVPPMTECALDFLAHPSTRMA